MTDPRAHRVCEVSRVRVVTAALDVAIRSLLDGVGIRLLHHNVKDLAQFLGPFNVSLRERARHLLRARAVERDRGHRRRAHLRVGAVRRREEKRNRRRPLSGQREYRTPAGFRVWTREIVAHDRDQRVASPNECTRRREGKPTVRAARDSMNGRERVCEGCGTLERVHRLEAHLAVRVCQNGGQ
jgi:hypothetical protein